MLLLRSEFLNIETLPEFTKMIEMDDIYCSLTFKDYSIPNLQQFCEEKSIFDMNVTNLTLI